MIPDSPDYVKHPLIKENSIQKRQYQENILLTSLEKNTLCVLPTGLGKTPIAAMLAAHRLERFPESRILVMAPTRPLTVQHHKTFRDFINLPDQEIEHVTGVIKPEKRRNIYKERRIILATPQTIKNDLEEERLSLKDFSLLVIDETHHAVGGYAYPYVVKRYIDEADNQRILGLTASPGGDAAKIADICKNAGIETVEIRTETDQDVTPYIQQKNIDFVYTELPESFLKIRELVQSVYDSKLSTLLKMGLIRRKNPSKKELISLQTRLSSSIKRGYKKSFIGIFTVVQAIKLEHAITVLETQGITMLESYWKKLRSGLSKSDQSLAKNKTISNAMWLTNNLSESGASHPKISKLCSIVYNQLRENPDSRIIVFANYRDTVRDIVKALSGIDSSRAVEFVGQREGLTQKEQSQRVLDFSSGKYNILVATSVAEEGIDIKQADIAIFYEPVPSGIRSIQRRGRVGRHSFGKVYVLITKGTRDEVYYWTSQYKEKQMKKTFYGMQRTPWNY